MYKLNSRQLCFIIITTASVGKLFFMPGLLSGLAEEGLILSALINYAIDFMLLLFILNAYKREENFSFYTMLESSYGKVLSKAIITLYAVFFVLKVFIPMIEEKNSIELTFYETQPNVLTYIPVFAITFYVSLKGIKSFSKSMEIVTILFFIGILLIYSLSFNVGDYDNLLPLFARSPKQLFDASFKTLLWFGDPIYILFFLNEVKKDNKITSKIIISYVISILIIIVTLAIFYAIFGSIAKRQFYAPIKMSKYSITLSNIGRFDYVGTLLLSFASIFLISMPLMFSSSMIKRVYDFKKSYTAPLIVNGIALALTLIFENGFFNVLSWFQNYGIYPLILFTYLIPIITFIVYRRKCNATQKN
ncbi:MAG: GerAB/ArcD/ProY family transporter [Clostridia bacterium]|nr:GerAB/ArcD/ProY family transporter [Clostridia bacterium]